MSLMHLDYGYAEPFEHEWHAKSKYFPSKIGGRPSFLVLNPIPGYKQLKCSKCSRTCRFVLQIYAPMDNWDGTFHRSLFVFACGVTPECVNEFKVFRCQLARENQFYSTSPPNYHSEYEERALRYNPTPEAFKLPMCCVCGVKGDKKCSQCLRANYCSKQHQVAHWKFGGHKKSCRSSSVLDHFVDYPDYPPDSYVEKGLIFPCKSVCNDIVCCF